MRCRPTRSGPSATCAQARSRPGGRPLLLAERNDAPTRHQSSVRRRTIRPSARCSSCTLRSSRTIHGAARRPRAHAGTIAGRAQPGGGRRNGGAPRGRGALVCRAALRQRTAAGGVSHRAAAGTRPGAGIGRVVLPCALARYAPGSRVNHRGAGRAACWHVLPMNRVGWPGLPRACVDARQCAARIRPDRRFGGGAAIGFARIRAVWGATFSWNRRGFRESPAGGPDPDEWDACRRAAPSRYDD